MKFAGVSLSDPYLDEEMEMYNSNRLRYVLVRKFWALCRRLLPFDDFAAYREGRVEIEYWGWVEKNVDYSVLTEEQRSRAGRY